MKRTVLKRTVTVFDLARMRHLDLLALWHQLNPDGHHGQEGDRMARVSKDWLAAAILQAREPHI